MLRTVLPYASSHCACRAASPISLPPFANKRYVYGELHLSRLNLIYCVTRGAPLRGYIGCWRRPQP
jgi:hypothetical protein